MPSLHSVNTAPARRPARDTRTVIWPTQQRRRLCAERGSLQSRASSSVVLRRPARACAAVVQRCGALLRACPLLDVRHSHHRRQTPPACAALSCGVCAIHSHRPTINLGFAHTSPFTAPSPTPLEHTTLLTTRSPTQTIPDAVHHSPPRRASLSCHSLQRSLACHPQPWRETREIRGACPARSTRCMLRHRAPRP